LRKGTVSASGQAPRSSSHQNGADAAHSQGK
jgi:hypothetical protein